MVIYQGLANKIQDYFASLNIKIPQNSTICDFFMWEISDFNAQKNNYTTCFNH